MPRQSVLQKGSAVLVDRLGVPRARCFCGNPLIAPTASKSKVVYVGKKWPGVGKTPPAVVSPSKDPVTVFIVKDPKTGKQGNQAPGKPAAPAAATSAPVATTSSASSPTDAPQETHTAAPSAVTPADTSAPATKDAPATKLEGCYAATQEQEEWMTGDKYALREYVNITKQGQDYLVSGLVFGPKLASCTLGDPTIGGPIKMSRQGDTLSFNSQSKDPSEPPCTLELTIVNGEVVISTPGGDCSLYFNCGVSVGLDGVKLPISADASDCSDVDSLKLISTAVPAATDTVVPAAPADTAVPPTATSAPASSGMISVEFVSTCVDPVEVYWIDHSGTPTHYFTLQPGQRQIQDTFEGETWQFKNLSSSWDWTVPAGGGTHNICG